MYKAGLRHNWKSHFPMVWKELSIARLHYRLSGGILPDLLLGVAIYSTLPHFRYIRMSSSGMAKKNACLPTGTKYVDI